MLFKLPKILLNVEGNLQGTRIYSQGIVLHAPIMSTKMKTIYLIYHTDKSDPREDFYREETYPGLIIIFLP